MKITWFVLFLFLPALTATAQVERKPVVVKTGDDTDYKSLSALLIASGLLIAAVICKIKRGKEEYTW